jgi:hypothetical protein
MLTLVWMALQGQLAMCFLELFLCGILISTQKLIVLGVIRLGTPWRFREPTTPEREATEHRGQNLLPRTNRIRLYKRSGMSKEAQSRLWASALVTDKVN